ncbi:unnamed protein product [Amoebophrya sp. A25]|nr:unnamed protein product [Amoebophrya sp. A25]|eukprot:GSA25T00000137001.1
MQNRRGCLQFGEIASMVPVIALAPKAGERILDLCAAPGNKTLALADAVGQDGLVWANDYDIERTCWTLTRHTAKARSVGVAISCWDGCTLGRKILRSAISSQGQSKLAASPRQQQLPPVHPFIFDKVLCDVPCSADGTLRKYRDTVLDFEQKLRYAVFTLHPLQLDLLETAFSVVRPGGVIAYSTCSLNPVENEAVVREFLRRHPHEAELVPMFEEDKNDAVDGLAEADDACDVDVAREDNCAGDEDEVVGKKTKRNRIAAPEGKEDETALLVPNEPTNPCSSSPRTKDHDSFPNDCTGTLRGTSSFQCLRGLTTWTDVEAFLAEEEGRREVEQTPGGKSSSVIARLFTPKTEDLRDDDIGAIQKSKEEEEANHDETAKDSSTSFASKKREKKQNPGTKKKIFPSSVCPPSVPDARLRGCVRVSPHLESVAGGFFLALIRKKDTNATISDGEDIKNPTSSSSSTIPENDEQKLQQEKEEDVKQRQLRQAGYFKRLREKAKWRRELSSKWARFFTSTYDESLLTGFDSESPSGANATSDDVLDATQKQKPHAKEPCGETPVRQEGEKEEQKKAEQDSKHHVTPWDFYGISRESIPGGESSVFFHTSRGHKCPRKVCVVAEKLTPIVNSVLANDEEERNRLKQQRENKLNLSKEANQKKSTGLKTSNGQGQFQDMDDPELGFALPLIQLGLPLFKRERNEKYMRHLRCRYRPTQRMIDFLLKHQTKRRLAITSSPATSTPFSRVSPDHGKDENLSASSRKNMGKNNDFVEFLSRDAKEGLPMAEFLQWAKKGRISGIESLNDEVGAALLTNAAGSRGVCVFVTSQRVIVYADQDEVDALLWEEKITATTAQ